MGWEHSKATARARTRCLRTPGGENLMDGTEGARVPGKPEEARRGEKDDDARR